MKRSHTIWMIIGCTAPLLLIFFAPALGLGYGTSLFIFILFMFSCHLLMPTHGHGGHSHNGQDGNQQDSKTLKQENHEHHH